MIQFSKLTRVEFARLHPFRTQLASLHELDPPISRKRLRSITRSAFDARCFKFVVALLEEFAKECTPEWKLSALQIINSIVRETHHRHKEQKELIASRFARNLKTIFIHLFGCPSEEKRKIIRILNNWKKDGIFGPDVIDPLYELADPCNPIWDRIRTPQLDWLNVADVQNQKENTEIPTLTAGPAVSLANTRERSEMLKREEAGFDKRVLGRVAQLPEIAKKCDLFMEVETVAQRTDTAPQLDMLVNRPILNAMQQLAFINDSNLRNSNYFGYGATPIPEMQWRVNFATWMALLQTQMNVSVQPPLMVNTFASSHHHYHHQQHSFNPTLSLSGPSLETHSIWNPNLANANGLDGPVNPVYVLGMHCSPQTTSSALQPEALDPCSPSLCESRHERKRVCGEKNTGTKKHRRHQHKHQVIWRLQENGKW